MHYRGDYRSDFRGPWLSTLYTVTVTTVSRILEAVPGLRTIAGLATHAVLQLPQRSPAHTICSLLVKPNSIAV